jgi:hypothetical protein
MPLDYSPGHQKVWMMTDASATGVGGVITQGDDWRTARMAAFYSTKMSSAQRNYPVHEQKLLAGVETMTRHRDILQGVPFTWLTDHKALTHFLTQKNLSGWQARWQETIGEFDFNIEYLPGVENVLPDVLSRLYEFDMPGTVRAPSEYVALEGNTIDLSVAGLITMPVTVGLEASAGLLRRSARVAAAKDLASGLPAATPKAALPKAHVAPVLPPASAGDVALTAPAMMR